MTRRTRIKICCIADEHEAAVAVAAGVDVVGLVSAMPSGPGPIDEASIARVARRVPPGASSFLLTSLDDADAMIAQHRRCRTTAVQIVDWLPQGAYAKLRDALPGVGLIQVIHVKDPEAVAEAIAVAEHVDAVLLDSGDPRAAVKVLGGTGRVHDWNVSRRIVGSVSVPVYLAGGLTAANVGDAIAAAHPFGVDVCSGVRTEGALDEAKLHAFVDAVRAADAKAMA